MMLYLISCMNDNFKTIIDERIETNDDMDVICVCVNNEYRFVSDNARHLLYFVITEDEELIDKLEMVIYFKFKWHMMTSPNNKYVSLYRTRGNKEKSVYEDHMNYLKRYYAVIDTYWIFDNIESRCSCNDTCETPVYLVYTESSCKMNKRLNHLFTRVCYLYYPSS